YHAQSGVDAALQLREEIGDPSRISRINIATFKAAYDIIGKDPEKWRPATKETADHSLPYIVGMALLEGKIDNQTYSQGKLRSGRNLDFVGRVVVKEDPALTALYPDRGMANRVTLETASGEVHSKEVDVPRGHPLAPMSREEIEEKFRRLSRRKIPPRRADEVLKSLWELEKVKDVGELLRLCRVR
ncbi:MAG: MmgE/PrpD family protein, partial [Nitrososphaerota archaeon]|nr:MmgE/PrpD family protein [Nitrososphaerota archaeon]